MADMDTINETIDGTAYAFRLLEADVPTLTYAHAWDGQVDTSPTFRAWWELTSAVGVNRTGQPHEVGNWYAPGLFADFNGLDESNTSALTGKPLLAAAAARLSESRPHRRKAVLATLAMALKGGGMTLAAAVGAAGIIVRSPRSAPGKRSYVEQVLVPSILSAAAAA